MITKLFEILNAPSWIRQDIADLESELEAYRKTMGLSGIRYDTVKIKSSPKDRMPEYAARVEQMLKLIKRKQQEYLKAHDKVKELTDQLQGVEKSVIIQRYLEGKRYEDIAESFPISEAQMYRYRASAIEKLEKMIVNESEST